MADVTPGDPLAPPDRAASDALSAGPDAAPGSLGRLDKKYEILEIKRGGMGEVYICRSVTGEGQRVAFKTYQKRFFFNRASRDAFTREMSIWSRLTGLFHIMPALGIYHFDERPFVLMPEVEPGPSGEVTVRDLVRRGPLPIERALQLARGRRSRTVARWPGVWGASSSRATRRERWPSSTRLLGISSTPGSWSREGRRS
jgi:hypothetical protein